MLRPRLLPALRARILIDEARCPWETNHEHIAEAVPIEVMHPAEEVVCIRLSRLCLGRINLSGRVVVGSSKPVRTMHDVRLPIPIKIPSSDPFRVIGVSKYQPVKTVKMKVIRGKSPEVVNGKNAHRNKGNGGATTVHGSDSSRVGGSHRPFDKKKARTRGYRTGMRSRFQWSPSGRLHLAVGFIWLS